MGEVLTGDREGDLSALQGREWDAVVDTFTDGAPGAPAVRRTAELLSGRTGAYGYVSGMSVYAPGGPARPDESAPVRARGEQPDEDPLQPRSLAKLAAEQVLREAYDGPVLLPRVGIMVGPRDPSGRFTWWPTRMAAALRGGAQRQVVVPGDLSGVVQHSDARDIAAWMVRMLAERRGGTYNAVGPGRGETLGEVLAACLRAAGGAEGDVELVTVGEEALRSGLADVEEEDRPLWFPEDQIPQEAMDSSAALAAGLGFRPLEQTAADTLAWALAQDDPPRVSLGSFAQRERRLLETQR